MASLAQAHGWLAMELQALWVLWAPQYLSYRYVGGLPSSGLPYPYTVTQVLGAQYPSALQHHGCTSQWSWLGTYSAWHATQHVVLG